MKRFFARGNASIWTRNLVVLAVSTFLMRFGEAVVGSARTNFFVDVHGLTGGQILWLEGLREVPGLILIVLAAFTMHLPLARRAGAALLILGVGFAAMAFVNSYAALLAMAVLASTGMHLHMPLAGALGMCMTTRDRSGRVLGTMASVGAMASLVGMAGIAAFANVLAETPLGTYFLAGGAVIVISGVLLLRLPASVGATEAPQPRMLLKKRYSLYYALTFLEGTRKQVLGTLGLWVLVSVHGFGVGKISLLLLAVGVVNFLGAPVLGRALDRFGERRTLTVSYSLLVLCCVGYATLNAVWMLSGLLIVIRLLLVVNMGLYTYVNRIAPPEELTPTLSAGISINHVSSVVMPLVSGALLPLVGYQGVFLLTAGLVAAAIPFAMAMRTAGPPAHGRAATVV